ncbi:transmembrane protein, putative (macronuclear) [Tetrahymena thermophila SB210]|uniref:Transmembrane protein, putative n=1 Tax=Tetrahymena thermophila (strain SB210) TaxID=312017 RepID=W7XIC5_TETTS|nr:transmembrane protein, putative [Tetrahymena thermophila SB210]EWS74516.1 transmembrane protein, putative [Tetrahymena thermophila SB210]|eukprot:XP_012652946.1 transmembrane protein, putative [Tetrahymena thermophila SB210]
MMIKRGFIPILKYISRKFYTMNFHQIIRCYERGQFFSLLLMLTKGVLFLLLSIYNKEYTQISAVDNNMVFLNKNNYINEWQANGYAIYIQPVCLIINSSILIYLILCYINFSIFGYKYIVQPALQQCLDPNESIEIDDEEFLLKLNKKMYHKIYQIMSIYISIYEYILSTAILYYSLIQIQNPLAPINLLLALFIGTLIIDTDYDYSIDSQDYMARPYSPYNAAIYYLDLLVVGLISFTNNIDTLLLSIYFLTNGWFCSKICIYYQAKTRFWNIFTYYYFGTLCLTYFVSFKAFTSISLPSLATIIYIPIFYKISYIICGQQDKSSCSFLQEIFEENGNISLKSVDRGIRQQFFQDLQNQRINDQLQIQIFSLIVKQNQLLQKMQNNVSHNQLSMYSQIEQMQKVININERVLQFIKLQIQEISQKKREQPNKIVYLIFLLEILKNKKAYILEYYQTISQKLSIKQEQILKSIYLKFLKQKETIQNTTSTMNCFDDSFYQFINYEEKINSVYQIIQRGVQQKIEFISYLKKKMLDINFLVNKAKALRNIQLKARNSINDLSIINNENQDLISLQIFYIETLSFEEIDLIFSADSFSKIKQQKKKREKKFQIRHNIQLNDLFKNKYSCVIFTKVEDDFNLSIQKASQNFSKIFGINQKDALNQRVEILMPLKTPLIQKHREYIANYFQNQNKDTIQIKDKIMFVKSSKEYLIPIKTDIRLNYSYKLNEIGFTAIFQQVRDDCQYILFYIDTLNVIGTTQNDQDSSNQYINFRDIKNLGKYFPFLYKLKTQNKQQLMKEEEVQKEESDTKQFNSMQDILSFSSERYISITYIHKKHINKYLVNNIEYLLIIQYDDQSLILEQEEFEKSNFFYYLINISIQESGYKDIQNLYFMKLSNIRNLNPHQNGQIIFKYLNEYSELYQQSIPYKILENMQQAFQKRYSIASSQRFIKSINNSDLIGQKLNKQNEKYKFNSMNSKKLTNQSYHQIIRNVEENYEISQLSTNQIQLELKSQKQGILNNQRIEIISTSQFTPKDLLSQVSKRQEEFTQEYDKYNLNEDNKGNDDCTFQAIDRKGKDESMLVDFNQKEQISFGNQIVFSTKNSLSKLSPTKQQSLLANNDYTPLAIDKKEIDKQVLFDFYQNQQINTNCIEDQLYFSDRNHLNQISPMNQNILLTNNLQQQTIQKNLTYLSNENEMIKSKNNLTSYKDRKPNKTREQNIDKNSSSISRDQASSYKKSLINIIRRDSNIQAVRVVNIFGIATFLILTIITVQQYFNFMDYMDQLNQIMNSQNWPYEVQDQISKQLMHQNFLYLERQNNFTFTSQEVQIKFDTFLLEKINQSSVEFLKILHSMDQQLTSQMLQNQISNYQSQFYVNIAYDPLNISGVPSKIKIFFFEIRNSSLWYSLLVNNYYIYQQSKNVFGQLQEISLLQNMNIIQTGMQNTIVYFEGYQNQQILEVKNQISYLIGINMVVSAVCLLSIIPLYYFIQKKKQIILNLFSTFTVYQLQQIILQIKSFYYKNSFLVTNLNNADFDIQIFSSKLLQDYQNHKKQTLSNITKLPGYKLSIVLVICLIYFLLSLNPILNKIFIEIYLDNQSNNFMILDNLNQARSFILQSSGLLSFGTTIKLYPYSKVVLLSEYISQIRAIMNKTDQLLTNITKISNQFDISGRYQQSQYDNFFSPLFQDDICSLLEKNQQLILDPTKTLPDSCRKIQNGCLQQGLKLSLIKFQSIILDINNLIETNQDEQLLQAEQSLFKSLNLEDFFNFIDFLQEIFLIMGNFIVNNNNDYFQYIKQVELILFINQLVLIALTFGLGWHLFSCWIGEQINKIKQYLQIINIQNLLDNKYILLFIKNNSKL